LTPKRKASSRCASPPGDTGNYKDDGVHMNDIMQRLRR